MAPLENHVYRLDKMLTWLLTEQKKVEADAQLGGTAKQLARQLTDIKVLEQNMNDNKTRLKSLNEEGYKHLYNAGKWPGLCFITVVRPLVGAHHGFVWVSGFTKKAKKSLVNIIFFHYIVEMMFISSRTKSKIHFY